MPPLVSVIVTSFNHARFIRKALDSVYAQTYRAFEVIVVDDASTDGSQQIIKAYQKKYGLTFIERKENYYSATIKNSDKPIIEAMKVARGDYIAVVDSDDYIFPEKLAIQVGLMESNPQASLCYGGIKLLLSDKRRYDYITDFPQGDVFTQLLITGNFLLYIGCLIRRSAWLKIERSHPELMQEDWDMFLRLAKVGHFIADRRTVACYCRHGNNTWFRKDRELLMYENRMLILDQWQHEPEWPSAMNQRWQAYIEQQLLLEQDVDHLLLKRPQDALLHYLKFNSLRQRSEHALAQRHLYKSVTYCNDKLAVLPQLFKILLEYYQAEDAQYKMIRKIMYQRCPQLAPPAAFVSGGNA